MPELPEVETTRRGIAPELEGAMIDALVVREPRLRWPVPTVLESLSGQRIRHVGRRAKYLLLATDIGTAIVHLGMSGSLRFAREGEAPRKHDHVELRFTRSDGTTGILRFHDPRRFGCWLWTEEAVSEHSLLASLGPEPLDDDFSADYLYRASRKRRLPVKSLIMNGSVVVGVGNIYASEALFIAGIRPGRAAARLTRDDTRRLVDAIKLVLQRSIDVGGTTLRDFVNGNGEPGYFAQSLSVYGRSGEPCRVCGTPVRSRIIAQRSTFYCPHCQR